MDELSQYAERLERSFNKAADKITIEKLSKNFFDKFFSIYPETQDFFKQSDMNYFSRKKMKIIFEFLVDIVKHPKFAEDFMAQEVMRHQMYGLRDKEYYFTLAGCLQEVVKEALEDEWDPETESVWNDVMSAFKGFVSDAAEIYL
jgi:hemoglobin-like flavoprotein